MYLEIIGKFSALTWIVYVMGLEKIDDSLLKWLAEYTKEHPWRFVFLENTQTSWNFSENRDRCVQDFAPAPIERELAYREDLDQPSVSQLRPTHLQPYPRIKESLLFDESTLRSMDWDQMAAASVSFFFQASSGPAQAQDASAPAARPIDVWHAFNKTVKVQENFQQYCNSIFDEDSPCLVLLCSPPGKCATHTLMVSCYLWLLLLRYLVARSRKCACCVHASNFKHWLCLLRFYLHLDVCCELCLLHMQVLAPPCMKVCVMYFAFLRRCRQIALCGGGQAQNGGKGFPAIIHRWERRPPRGHGLARHP